MVIMDVIVAIGPVLGYIAQLNLIKKQKSLGTFSIDVCAILLIASIFRVFFWFAKGYALNLLFQAICIIIIMLILLYQCVKFSTFKTQKFWRWKDYDVYLKFLLILASILTITTIIFMSLNIKIYGQIIGYMSLSIQALLGFPQMISNLKKKSVQGLSLQMIGSWVIGDAFKTFYFITQKQPFQFIMCGSIQLTVDFIIIIQILLYRKKQLPKSFVSKEGTTQEPESQTILQ